MSTPEEVKKDESSEKTGKFVISWARTLAAVKQGPMIGAKLGAKAIKSVGPGWIRFQFSPEDWNDVKKFLEEAFKKERAKELFEYEIEDDYVIKFVVKDYEKSEASGLE